MDYYNKFHILSLLIFSTTILEYSKNCGILQYYDLHYQRE